MDIFRFWRWELQAERPAIEYVIRDHDRFAVGDQAKPKETPPLEASARGEDDLPTAR